MDSNTINEMLNSSFDISLEDLDETEILFKVSLNVLFQCEIKFEISW